MKRRTLLALLATLSIAIIGMFGGATNASAQIPVRQCQTRCYTVDLTRLQGLPDVCWPICIQTQWANGVTWPAAGVPCYPKPDIYRECPPVPVGTPLNRIIVCGVSLPGVTGQYTVQCPGCPIPFCVVVCLDANGCLYIKLYQGPCPGTPLPCP